MKSIAITTTSFAQYDNEPITLLEKNDLTITYNPYGRKLRKDEIVELCQNAVGIIAGTEPLEADVLEKLPNLKVISRCGTGLDSVDLKAAQRLNIKVLNTPDAPTLAVAELTVGLILNLLRKVSIMDIAIRNGKWEKLMGNLLSQKRVGIIGFGKIGQKVAELLVSLGCDVIHYDIMAVDTRTTSKRVELDELLETSDIISIHISSKAQIIGKDEFKKIKKGAWLVNAARGGVIDEAELYGALKDGYLSGAALDGFEQEPYTGQLRELDNIILTPHIGSYAMESRINMELESAKNLLKGLGLTS